MGAGKAMRSPRPFRVGPVESGDKAERRNRRLSGREEFGRSAEDRPLLFIRKPLEPEEMRETRIAARQGGLAY